jgi:[ribosomal protein S18]-alanine N-acetyltransferase
VKIEIRDFRYEDAKFVATWSYDPPYDIYDDDPIDFEDYLVRDENDFGYFAIVSADDDEIVGFCCFGPEARVVGQEAIDGVVDIGGGIRPDLVSTGVATAVFPTIIQFALAKYGPTQLRTAVATFNERSTRLCISAGFEIVRRFDGPGREFYELVRTELV